MKTRRRDVIIIITMLVLAISGFFISHYFLNRHRDFVNITVGKARQGNLIKEQELILSIDFSKNKIIVFKEEDGYPIINYELGEIIILGAPQSGHRHEFVIAFDFKNKTVAAKEANCPDQVCVKRGERKFGTIICVPNKVTISYGKLPAEDGDNDGIV